MPARLATAGHFGFAAAAAGAMHDNLQKAGTPRARTISPTSATRSRSRAACWRTKACSTPSAMSACAIPADPGRYPAVALALAAADRAGDVLEFTLDSEPVHAAHGAALRRARDPRLHLSGAARRDGGVPPSCAGGDAVLHRGRADRAGVPPRRGGRRERCRSGTSATSSATPTCWWSSPRRAARSRARSARMPPC